MSQKTDNKRISFSSVKNRMPYPDLLEVQLKSFQDFFQLDTTAENRKNEGLYKVFMENFPITDTRNNFVGIHRLLRRSAPLLDRRVPGTRPHVQCSVKSQTEIILYRP